MDEKVKILMDRVRETAAAMGEVANSAASAAGRYAGQITDAAKLNIMIFDLNAEISELLRQLGQTVYDTHLGKDSPEDSVTDLLEQLDEKQKILAETRERVTLLRQTRICPNCDTACGREDKYCKECGGAL